jgi:TetR/AcrR family transcriptional regulator, cholesterol catabolism regulator
MTAPELGRRGEREREILDAAARLFRERGYSSTTIRDIGVAAGLNHATSHYYFGSKAAILFAIFSEALDGFFVRIDHITGPPDDALTDIVRAAVIEAARRPDQTAVFFQERHWLEQLLPPERSQALRERQDAFRIRVMSTVEDGIHQGLFKRLDPNIVVEMIVAMATWAYQQYEPDGTTTVDVAAEQCADLIVGGLRTDPPRNLHHTQQRQAKGDNDDDHNLTDREQPGRDGPDVRIRR